MMSSTVIPRSLPLTSTAGTQIPVVPGALPGWFGVWWGVVSRVSGGQRGSAGVSVVDAGRVPGSIGLRCVRGGTRQWRR